MSEHFHEFFRVDDPENPFHQVIALHEAVELTWDKISALAPFLPRGWYELSQLPVSDRIEFTRDYWLSKIGFFSANCERKLCQFFENLEDIGIFAAQSKQTSLCEVHMVYSLKHAAGFFHGRPPITQEALEDLVRRFEYLSFPDDYLGFLLIHDGFSKYTDTGLIPSREMSQVYQRFQRLLAEEIIIRPDGEMIDPARLIPFYESFGLHCYQCFYADWHPEEGMGNLYFSEQDRSISNFLDSERLEDNLAFPTFLKWLTFYLEDIWNL